MATRSFRPNAIPRLRATRATLYGLAVLTVTAFLVPSILYAGSRGTEETQGAITKMPAQPGHHATNALPMNPAAYRWGDPAANDVALRYIHRLVEEREQFRADGVAVSSDGTYETAEGSRRELSPDGSARYTSWTSFVEEQSQRIDETNPTVVGAAR